ncbi:RNA 2',3'-cyclic phosphodiesterase [Denitratisoma oestradiolicum]|uniref:RNA 2',3'-cyclic phosphodiesterase n=1 Tax=Denitratisoma oestradiolicum TaxID=311182 RepID=A0A6S6XYM6_9PROT|nr:RNA 2',3'-cyclic phosphodiesterase [Denitratisoma oestradiolicum]TWO79367.1 2'-5' RNA ligase [Denitratisoma oestradiolicum]CAB1367979.1 RNA 2',3'-cyclic phosphodiesterase [Denitratisoma oestradiolicum]
MGPAARPDSRRLFFALWPSTALAGELHRLAAEARPACGGRLMARDTLHLTLAFLGQVEETRLLELHDIAAAIRVPAFTLTLDRLGYWRHNRILWAGCATLPPELEALAAALHQALRHAGFAMEERPFAAHVTLLRNARCEVVPGLALSQSWSVAGFGLVESRPSPAGADYRMLASWPLVPG